VLGFLCAYAYRLPGLRTVTERCSETLGSSNFSSLSHALARPSSLAFVRRLVELLESRHCPRDNELVAIDGMSLTVSSKRRHRAKRCNRYTAGGGVVWTYAIRAAHGACPVKVLKIIEGAWHDTRVMRGVELIANGPVYLMDRGFYSFELLEKWLSSGVRFITRVRERSLTYETLRTLSLPRRIGDKSLLLDAVVRLGCPNAKRHPEVRLIVARLASGENLILATDRMDWSAERILAAYKQRWHIERFHRFLKETLGLAHLYSFHGSGMAFLLYTSLLLALLLLLSEEGGCGVKEDTITRLFQALRDLRSAAGIGPAWKRNACTRKPRKKARKKTSNL